MRKQNKGNSVKESETKKNLEGSNSDKDKQVQRQSHIPKDVQRSESEILLFALVFIYSSSFFLSLTCPLLCVRVSIDKRSLRKTMVRTNNQSGRGRLEKLGKKKGRNSSKRKREDSNKEILSVRE